MSTSSAYSKNKLQDVLNNKTEHFILKSYVMTVFEHDRKEPEYHLYWYNKNAGNNPEHPEYIMISHKKMGKKELRFFRSIIDQYKRCNECEDGVVWEHKELGFNKKRVRATLQMPLDLFSSIP